MAKKNIQILDEEYKKHIETTINEYNTNGRKTIAYFCDTYYPIVDGVIKVMENYAIKLSENYNVVVVVPKHKNKEIVPHEKFLVIGSSGMYFKFVNYDLAFPEMDTYLKKVLKKLRIDIIHCHSPFNIGSFAAKLAKRRKIPFVMTMHSQYKVDFLKYTKSEPIASALAKNICKVFNKASEVWTMHEKASQTLQSYGYKGKFFYIRNATDYVAPENQEQLINEINERYNIKPETPVFLFVGRLVNQKNILFILESLNNLNKQGIEFKMFFIGDGPDKNELEENIKKFKLEDKVILTGKIMNREELFKYYARSTLFLFPSVYDTSSIVQIESACFKTPTVFIKDSVTACGVTHNHNGFLSENNLEAFTNTIIEALSNKENLERVSENARNELYLTWDDVKKQALERYEYLIKQNKNKLSKLETVQKVLKQNKKS